MPFQLVGEFDMGARPGYAQDAVSLRMERHPPFGMY